MHGDASGQKACHDQPSLAQITNQQFQKPAYERIQKSQKTLWIILV